MHEVVRAELAVVLLWVCPYFRFLDLRVKALRGCQSGDIDFVEQVQQLQMALTFCKTKATTEAAVSNRIVQARAASVSWSMSLSLQPPRRVSERD